MLCIYLLGMICLNILAMEEKKIIKDGVDMKVIVEDIVNQIMMMN